MEAFHQTEDRDTAEDKAKAQAPILHTCSNLQLNSQHARDCAYDQQEH